MGLGATALGTQNIGSLSSEFNTFQSQFQLSSSFHSSSSQLDLQLDYVPQDSASQPYVHLPQAYYQFRGDYFDLSFGRRTYQWSQMDEIFNIGVWQPQYRRDFSRPKQEGFFGAFVGGKPSSQVAAICDTSILTRQRSEILSARWAN